MTLPAWQRHTFAEYVRLDAQSTVKHEFLDGAVWAMAGGSPAHAAIAANVIALLLAALRDRPCRVHSSDLRVRVQSSGLATYPDVTVLCGTFEPDPEDPHTALNPAVIVEVTSPSTEAYDRGEKLAHYRTIPSLRDVVLVSQDARRVEVWSRADDGTWSSRDFAAGTAAHLPSFGIVLPLDEVYRDPLARSQR
jgi:Uma2 family endonuclease